MYFTLQSPGGQSGCRQGSRGGAVNGGERSVCRRCRQAAEGYWGA